MFYVKWGFSLHQKDSWVYLNIMTILKPDPGSVILELVFF